MSDKSYKDNKFSGVSQKPSAPSAPKRPTPAPSSGQSNAFHVTGLRTFSSDGGADSTKLFADYFYANRTAYVGLQISFDPSPYPREFHIRWQIFKADGTAFSKLVESERTISPNNTFWTHSWGWKEYGNWPVGRYYLTASINGGPVSRADFEIRNGSFDYFPARIRNVKLFPSGSSTPPYNERTYATSFKGGSVNYINFQPEFYATGREISTFYSYRIQRDDGHLVVNRAYPIQIRGGSTWISFGWGSMNLEFWKPGTYTYDVSIGDSNVIHGTFDVTDPSARPEYGVTSKPKWW